MTIPEALQIAVQHHQLGRLGDAEGLYRQILAVQPNHADAMHLLGVIAQQVGRHAVAVEWIRKATTIDPNNPLAFSNLGVACCAIGEFDAAIAAFRRSLELKPDSATGHLNLGNVLRAQGQLDSAIAEYHRSLALKPEYPDAHYNLGIALYEQDRFDEAIAACRRALELRPDFPEAHLNLGNALRSHNRSDEGIAAYRRALELKPDYLEAHLNLGNVLRDQNQLDESIAAYRRALGLKPDYPAAHYNLGNALRNKGEFDQAIATYCRAIALEPNLAEAHNNLGATLAARARLDEAVSAFRRAIQLKPDYEEAHSNLGAVSWRNGQLDEAINSFRHAHRLKPDDAVAHSNLIYALHFHPDNDVNAIDQERQRWNQRFGDPLRQFILPHATDRNPTRKLRVGYVSPDFCEHVVGRNLLPLLRNHDDLAFEVFCYSGVINPDELTEEFGRHARQWRSTVGVADEALADMIRRDGVDILVDLTQHMAGNRLPMFARQPAPVQVSFAGYPESTGLQTIEHRISDYYLEADSTGGGAPHEQGVCFIDSFWCYDPCRTELEVNELPALRNGIITFGCLGNLCKVNEHVLRLWARTLAMVENSHLIVLGKSGVHQQWMLDVLQREGIDSQRVEFVARRPHREYLELYRRLDIVLDTFPYNGHTTSLDALWMGVPVVSLAGARPVSRAGLSQLTNLGLPELVSHSEADYVRTAVELANDLPRQRQLRSTLRGRMENSVLMDAPGFARQIEGAYREMWQRWCSLPE